MSSRRNFFLVLSLALLVSAAFAAKKDAEAASLIEHAKLLSDIRTEGAPPFRLKLSFKIIKEDGSVVEGAYTEIWVSKTQWRREMVLGDFRSTQVVAGRKRWDLSSTTVVPEHLGDFLSLTNIGRFQPEAWKLGQIADRQLNGLRVRCLEVKTGPYARSALCFDGTSGAIVADFIPSQSGIRTGEAVCFYNDYQKFGDRELARSYECDDENKHPRIEARVDELAAAPVIDLTSFTPPEGAKESVNCPTPIKHPTVIYNPDPKSPRTSGERTPVVLSLVVGADGKPHDLRVISAPNRDSDSAALEAVRRWTFNPATCDGEPVETRLAVEVNFSSP